jgi:hypothetical protein
MLNTFKLGARYPVSVGQIEAKKDPVSNKWMIPAYATDVDLIEEKEGFQRYFKDRAWHYVADNIGTEYWDEDGTKHTINEVGEELPEGALLEEPPEPVEEVEQEEVELEPTLESQTELANSECTTRINQHWNQIGQINASLGVYGEEDTANCATWISSNRSALISLLAREDLLEIDVSSDEHWPIFEGSN